MRGGSAGGLGARRDGLSPQGAGHWRALGAGLLLAFPVAAVFGILETIFADLRQPATALEIFYGIDIHLLIALCAAIAARFVFWRSPARTFPLIALAALAVVEAAIVVPYWIVAAPWAPRFASTTGRLFALAVILVGEVIVIGLGWILIRSRRGERWPRLARSASAIGGLAFACALIIGNSAALIRGWPRTPEVKLRDDALSVPRADVIVILVDTLRRDHVSFFGYDRPTSPNIDRLLGESYVFSAGYTPSNETIPSIASLFTGLYPTSCEIRGPYEAIPQEAPTLAEHFRSYGYRTGAFIGNLIITAQGGYAQGFETYFPRSAPWWTYRRRTAVELIAQRLRKIPNTQYAARLNDEFLRWLDDSRAKNPSRPVFAYLHYMEPHSPYAPQREDLLAVAPQPANGPAIPPLYQDFGDEDQCNDWETLVDPPQVSAESCQGMIDRYDGEIHAFDRQLGKLLAELEARGTLQRAHVLFLSDHGEQFGDHGGWYHGHAIYDELILSPMAYRPPGGLDQRMIIERPVAMLDLVRTLVTLAGLETPALHQGREIAELTAAAGAAQTADGATQAGAAAAQTAGAIAQAGAAAAQPAGAIAQDMPVLSELPPNLYGLRLREWKLVQRGPASSPIWRLFNVESDPGERNDLSNSFPDTLEIMRAYLVASLANLQQRRLDHIETVLDKETLQQLRDLGYIH